MNLPDFTDEGWNMGAMSRGTIAFFNCGCGFFGNMDERLR
jgi:hypothetical protein